MELKWSQKRQKWNPMVPKWSPELPNWSPKSMKMHPWTVFGTKSRPGQREDAPGQVEDTSFWRPFGRKCRPGARGSIWEVILEQFSDKNEIKNRSRNHTKQIMKKT